MRNDHGFIFVCLIATVLLLQGCMAKWAVPGGPDSPTEGLSMQMLMEGKTLQIVRYRFDGNGLLLFAGGPDVPNDRFSWEGVIPAEYGHRIAEAVRRGKWFEEPPTGNGSESATWTIRAWNRSGQGIHFTVYGEDESVQEVYDLLSRVAAARVDGFMKDLPKPSLDRQLKREDAADSSDSQGAPSSGLDQ